MLEDSIWEPWKEKIKCLWYQRPVQFDQVKNWKPPYLLSRKSIWPRVKVCSDKCHNFLQDGSYIKILNFTAYCTFLDVEGSWASWHRVWADVAAHIAWFYKPQPPHNVFSHEDFLSSCLTFFFSLGSQLDSGSTRHCLFCAQWISTQMVYGRIQRTPNCSNVDSSHLLKNYKVSIGTQVHFFLSFYSFMLILSSNYRGFSSFVKF